MYYLQYIQYNIYNMKYYFIMLFTPYYIIYCHVVYNILSCLYKLHHIHVQYFSIQILLGGYHMGCSVIWFYQTSGGAISWTSEERASEWYHTNTSLIKSYHTVTHVIIFLSYTTTPGIIEAASIPITPIYIYILQYNTERRCPLTGFP